MTSDPILNISELTADYGGQAVIESVSMSVPKGHIYGLIGLNGAGKSTTIRIALGLRDPSSGHVQINNRDRLDPKVRSSFAYLPEKFEPPSFLSGYEFIDFSLSLYGRKTDRETVDKHAQSLALDPSVLKKTAQTYSKGMRQKLGILATVLTLCPLLILDEPMSGLDPLARARVKDMLVDMNRTHGVTIFMSSHILADMDEICETVSVLSNKTIVFTGSPETLKTQTKQESLERAFLELELQSQKTAA